MKKTVYSALALAALFSSTATAQEVSFTYVDVALDWQSSFDNTDIGFSIAGSYGFADRFHARVEYGSYSDDGFIDGDFDGFDISIGAHPQITESLYLVTELGFYSYDADDFDEDTDAIFLRLGARALLADNFELHGSLEAADGDSEFDDYRDVVVRLGGRYHFNENISGAATWSEGSNVFGDVIRFDVRWSFGNR